MTPLSTSDGISAASQGARPKHNACATPKCGAFLAQSGLKWMVRQIFPPRYIFAVLPSSSGSSISNGVAGYVTGTSNCKSNSYRMSSCTYQHLPVHLVPSRLEAMVNQSLSFALLLCTNPISAWYSSLSRLTHSSPSRGPALTVSSGIFFTTARVVESHESISPPSDSRTGRRRGVKVGARRARVWQSGRQWRVRGVSGVTNDSNSPGSA
mmetsp:Transcript_9482/g.15153  ORF Transcript_9482/g.15153 Transcript_9482/m.15153 type:complete len:210 (-) Transcript_9482:113-742(-)